MSSPGQLDRPVEGTTIRARSSFLEDHSLEDGRLGTFASLDSVGQCGRHSALPHGTRCQHGVVPGLQVFMETSVDLLVPLFVPSAHILFHLLAFSLRILAKPRGSVDYYQNCIFHYSIQLFCASLRAVPASLSLEKSGNRCQ